MKAVNDQGQIVGNGQTIDAEMKTRLEEYERLMREEGIPEILRAVKRRQRLAYEARRRWLGEPQ